MSRTKNPYGKQCLKKKEMHFPYQRGNVADVVKEQRLALVWTCHRVSPHARESSLILQVQISTKLTCFGACIYTTEFGKRSFDVPGLRSLLIHPHPHSWGKNTHTQESALLMSYFLYSPSTHDMHAKWHSSPRPGPVLHHPARARPSHTKTSHFTFKAWGVK